jgi:hypothetical protein
MRNELLDLADESTLTANAADNAKKRAEAEKRRHELRTLELQMDSLEIKGMAHRTAQEQELVALAKAKYDFSVEEERIIHSGATGRDKDKLVTMNMIDLQRRKKEIEEEFAEKRLAAEKKFYDFVDRQQGDLLKRRLTALDQEYLRRVADSGLKISLEQQQADMAERRARETDAFRRAEVKALEAELSDLAKTKGRALTFAEEIVSLYQLGAALHKSSEAVKMLQDKLTSKQERKESWFEGMKAGLLDVANTMEDRFTMMRKLVKSVADGMRSAFSSAIAGMLSGTMTLSQGLKSLWKGIADTIVKAVADMAAQFIVAQISMLIFQNTARTASGAGAAAAYELAVMESWAAYAGIPFTGWAMAMAQIAAITATYAGVKGMSLAGDASAGGGTAAASEGMNYAGYASGGLVTRPGFVAENPYSRELVAPESTFLDWIKNIGSPALAAPTGSYRNASGGELAFAGGGSSVHASFDGAMIIGDSVDGLRKAASALRKIKSYDDRVNA